MFKSITSPSSANCLRLRCFHGTTYETQASKQKHPPLLKSVPDWKPDRLSSPVLRDVHKVGVGDETPVQEKTRPKRNELGVQLLSNSLHAQIFRNVNFPAPDPSVVQIARDHLEAHGLDPKHGSVLPDISFTLPPLQGANLPEHYYRIGKYVSAPYLDLANDLAKASLPPKPTHWDIQSGWTRYHFLEDGSSYSEHVDYPESAGHPEQLLVFDVETMPAYHPYPVLAVAASPNSWYSWVSPWLLQESDEVVQLVPFGNPTVSRIVVGHNVSFDRACIKEEYSLSGTRTRFLDTMALHVAVKGISSHQRPAWVKYRKKKEKEREQHDEAVEAVRELMRSVEEHLITETNPPKIKELSRLRKEMSDSLSQLSNDSDTSFISRASSGLSSSDDEEKRWEDLTSANSLADVAQLHCGIALDKTVRNDLMNLTPEEIRENINDYLDYCSSDVEATHAVYASVLPSFLAGCPHPASFAGVLTMGSSLLPVNSEWERYITQAEAVYRELENQVRTKLKKLAEDARDMAESEAWKDDAWLSQLDWTPKVAGKSRGIFTSELEASSQVPKSKRVKPRPVFWPKWYWDATKPKAGLSPGTLDVTVRSRIAPLLLHLSWLGYPLFHSREHGWIFRVPSSSAFATRSSPLSFYNPADDDLADASLHGGYVFYKLPHKDGEKANVGYPLGKTFIKYATDGTLCSPGNEARQALELNAQCSYWISARDRIMNQLVMWQKDGQHLGFPALSDNQDKWGIILPQMIAMGTVTRRAIEKTWLTASNAKANRVGSELKAMVRAPPGYVLVGADVDSEELWISSCMGDAQFGLHGATALGWMTLEGTKSAGTDLHSKTAKILGISREQAKIFNYSRIYGAGMRHAVLLLLQSNASMLPETAQNLAENLYVSTKGRNTHRTDLFGRKFWFGGSESFVFNKLEEIATSDKPQTPALGCGVTDALSKEYLPTGFGSDYMPSRINWVVQSSGVDYLHLLIVSMDYLISKYDISARFLISVHDEVRYLVKEVDKYRAALALQIANLWTRSLFAYNLGMDDLPQGVAFFSAVDIDTVLRKEVDMPCVTPSQPIPIPPGESLDITGILGMTNGGSLRTYGSGMLTSELESYDGNLEGYISPNCLTHRASSAEFLRAQASADMARVKELSQQVHAKKSLNPMRKKKQSRRPSLESDLHDWSSELERLLSP